MKWFYICIFCFFLYSFNYMMEQDKNNLCSTDLTAYDGCN